MKHPFKLVSFLKQNILGKIGNCIVDFIVRMGEIKRVVEPWIVATLCQVTTTKRVMDLLNTENKGRGQIIAV